VSLRAHVDLLPEPASAGAGRRAVAEVLTDWGVSPETVSDAMLVVSEIVTNALLHAPAEDPLALDLSLTDGVLRVAVSDTSDRHPLRRSPAGHDEGGRGIGILDALASRWGVSDRVGGKSLWFEIDLVS
jgi:anti-sigma regulatory factor (Ser/Thr protein kinase)